MALDDTTAAKAAANAAASMALPLAAPQLFGLCKAIIDAIRDDAVVDPAGDTPMTVSVSGTPTAVTGTGKLT